MQIALASRSLAPFGGGGIGEYADTAARILASIGEVTIFTTDLNREAYDALLAEGDPAGLLVPDVEYVFVPEPEDPSRFYTVMHRVRRPPARRDPRHYPGGGPELVEVSDYLGEGFVLAQATATGDPRLSRSLLAVRLHTTAEMCAVLDGHLDRTDFTTRVTAEIERYALRHADVLLWPGGDVLGLYERFYGAANLAPARLIRNPLLLDGPLEADPVPAAPEGPLKLLYLGRLERRKGVQNLLRAMPTLRDRNWRLTLLGGDTQTAPLGASMRLQLEQMAASDPQIEFADEVRRADLGAFISAHDVVVLPSLWECWPYVALEAMRRNRPVLATPTGGFAELIRPGVNGWLTADTTAEALADALDELLADREGILELRRRPARRPRSRRLPTPTKSSPGTATAPGRSRAARRARRRATPLVSVIVPYYRMAEFVEATIRSIAAQTYPAIETIVVNDGSFGPEDRILEELAARYPLTVLRSRTLASAPRATSVSPRRAGATSCRWMPTT